VLVSLSLCQQSIRDLPTTLGYLSGTLSTFTAFDLRFKKGLGATWDGGFKRSPVVVSTGSFSSGYSLILDSSQFIRLLSPPNLLLAPPKDELTGIDYLRFGFSEVLIYSFCFLIAARGSYFFRLFNSSYFFLSTTRLFAGVVSVSSVAAAADGFFEGLLWWLIPPTAGFSPAFCIASSIIFSKS